MNLNDMRNRVKSLTDYFPEMLDWQNRLDEAINRSYEQIWRDERWTWTQELFKIRIYPDLDNTRTGLAASWADGQRIVTFNGAFPLMEEGSARSHYEGQPIALNDRHYTIVKIIDDGISSGTASLAVDEPIRIEGGVAQVQDSTSWKIISRWYWMPQDLSDFVYLKNSQYDGAVDGFGGRIKSLPARKEAEWVLEDDWTQSWAESYIPHPPDWVPPGQTFGVSWVDAETPDIGNLPEGKYYEWAWAFVTPDGKVGPLSKSQLVQVPSTQSSTAFATIEFQTHDKKPILSLNSSYTAGPGTKRPWEGMRKRLFYNANLDPDTGERWGKPCFVQMFEDHPPSSPDSNVQDYPLEAEDFDSTIEVRYVGQMRPNDIRQNDVDGGYWKIEFWPRVDDWNEEYEWVAVVTGDSPQRRAGYFKEVEGAYWKTPEPLILETDVPKMPSEFHNLICYGAAAEVLDINGNTGEAERFRKLRDAGIKEMKKRYLLRDDTDWRFGSFTGQPWGVPDWTTFRRMN